jgi:hypothetical protein
MTDDYVPTAAEIAELRAATLYSYEAGVPPSSIASDWVRKVVGQPDGGLVDVIDALKVAQEVPDPIAEVETLARLLNQQISREPCSLDCNGDCQAHMWFGDGRCPTSEAVEFLTSIGKLDRS